MNRRPRQCVPATKRSRRRGLSLVECTAATVLLGAGIVLSLQLQLSANAQRRAAEQRQLAGWEVSNLMETLTALPYATVTAEHARELVLSQRGQQTLRGAQLEVAITESPQRLAKSDRELTAKQVQISLRWLDRQGQLVAPVRLSAWIYAPPASSPATTGETP